MLPKNHRITYTFFDIGGGDAIWIRFWGTDENWHNVLIDGGYGYAYKTAFGPLIGEILSEGEKIDLWIITHIDRDHIGAVLGFVQDKKIKDKPLAVRQFWFNHSAKIVKESNGKLAVNDGINLRTYLNDNKLLSKGPITTTSQEVNFFGLKLKAVSPSPTKQAIAEVLWQDEEKKGGKTGRATEKADHMKTIEDLINAPFHVDTDPVNGSSIALRVEYQTISVLLLADSHPSDVTETLISMGCSTEKPLAVSFMQLAHHGSKANTSPHLLNLIDTSEYVITGNGIHNRHPDKETLVRLLTRAKGQALNMHFPCATREIRAIFDADTRPNERYNFTCTYRTSPQGTILAYLPVNEQLWT